ncbi:molecular chaperone [Klebsiella sp. CN_Kp098]|uniref:fimbrial biogenesis chaperone n=1 Tax=unclassified Klebsiella TaxID=2608929 RepID=UPI0032B51106
MNLSAPYRCRRLLPLTLLLSSLAAHAGLVVNSTRFIYPADSNSLSVSLSNTGDSPFLAQTRILADDGRDTAGSVPAQTYVGPPPFTALPPLFQMAGHQDGQVRLVRTGGNLPSDRESLFYLQLAAIPAGKPGPHSVQMAVRDRFKLFFRPAGLPGSPGTAYAQLTWHLQSGQLVVHNPTPYYVTLFNLNVEGHLRTNAGMVPPLSTRTLRGCGSGSCLVRWQSIDDYGKVLSVKQATAQ